MKKRSACCIEITGSSVKFLVVNQEKAQRMIASLDIAEIRQSKDEELSKMLLDIRKKLKIHSENPIIMIPCQWTTLTHLQLPTHLEEELEKMIELQVVNTVPYSPEEIVYDYAILGKNHLGYTKVLLVVIHKETVLRYLQIFYRAGFHPHQVTVSSVGLHQWYVFWKNKNKEPLRTVVLLNIDYAQTEICFCRGDSLLFSRQINNGAQDIKIFSLELFIEQISLTILIYTEEKMGDPIEEMIVLASQKETKPLIDRLKNEYKVKIRLIDPLEDFPSKQNLGRVSFLQEEGYSLAASAGILFSQKKEFLNLLPSHVSSAKEAEQRKQLWQRTGILLGLLLFLGCLILEVKNDQDLQYWNRLQKEIERQRPEVKKAEENIKRFNFVQETLTNRSLVLDVIDELYKRTPEGISFNSLDLDQSGTLILQGFAQSGPSMNNFQENMVNSPVFKNVNLEYAIKETTASQEFTRFKISCRLTVI